MKYCCNFNLVQPISPLTSQDSEQEKVTADKDLWQLSVTRKLRFGSSYCVMVTYFVPVCGLSLLQLYLSLSLAAASDCFKLC
jgi:hypothetical protein